MLKRFPILVISPLLSANIIVFGLTCRVVSELRLKTLEKLFVHPNYGLKREVVSDYWTDPALGSSSMLVTSV